MNYIFSSGLPRSGTALLTKSLYASNGVSMAVGPNVEIYRFLRDDFADLDIVDRKETALELLYRDMESNFGVNFNPNHALDKANFNRKVINYRLQKLLSR